MAVRRGVVVVLVLILMAVGISAAGLLFMGLAVGRGPQVSSNSTLLLDVERRSPGDRTERRARPVPRAAADRAIARRRTAQGERRPAGVERHHPADQQRRALGQGAGGARRDRRLQEVEEADHRLPRVRRRPVVLPGERLRQGLPDADGVARPDRHGQLRAVPPRHARQDRRVSGHDPRRRLQDGVEHVHGAHVHAGAPRDGRVAQHGSLRAADRGARRRPSPDGGGDARPRRPRPVPARGRRARRPRRRPRLRGRDRRQGPARARAHQHAAAARIPQRRPHLARSEPRAADRRDLRRRHDQLGRQQRVAVRPGDRLRHAWSSTCGRRARTTRFAPS